MSGRSQAVSGISLDGPGEEEYPSIEELSNGAAQGSA